MEICTPHSVSERVCVPAEVCRLGSRLVLTLGFRAVRSVLLWGVCRHFFARCCVAKKTAVACMFTACLCVPADSWHLGSQFDTCHDSCKMQTDPCAVSCKPPPAVSKVGDAPECISNIQMLMGWLGVLVCGRQSCCVCGGWDFQCDPQAMRACSVAAAGATHTHTHVANGQKCLQLLLLLCMR